MITAEKSSTYQVLGIDISDYSREDFFDLIEERLKDNDPHSPPFFVVTVNPEIVVQSIIDDEFKHILNSSSINTADGIGISWAVDFLYNREIERITGADSMEKICRLCARHTESIFLYGARPGVAERAADNLQQDIENLEIEGTYSPDSTDMPVEEHPFDIQYLMKKASVIFVALGAPAQEKWIHENLSKLPNCKLIIGVGGSFDFIAGEVSRAPSWLCRSGLEWLYRLIVQPSRWRRMLRLPVFALNVMLLKLSNPDQHRVSDS